MKSDEDLIKKVTPDVYREIDSDSRLGYKIDTLSSSSRLMSQIYGIPYWPNKEPLPTDENGNKLKFFLQIYLSEIEERWENDGLPETGMIQFFANEDFSSVRVVCHNSLEKATEPFLDCDNSFEGIRVDGGIRKLKFTKTRFRKNVTDDYQGSMLLGYKGSQINYHPVYDNKENEEKYNQLLLQIDSLKGVTIGDCGFVSFHINKEKLSEGDFSDVIGHFDCM